MDTPRLLEQLAATHGCSAETARALITDGLAALHEASYMRGTAAGVAAAHEQLGGLAAWHLMGLLVDAADSGDPGALVRAYMKIEPAPGQYDAIWARWDDQKARGLDP
jgi:hypothetical protein